MAERLTQFGILREVLASNIGLELLPPLVRIPEGNEEARLEPTGCVGEST